MSPIPRGRVGLFLCSAKCRRAALRALRSIFQRAISTGVGMKPRTLSAIFFLAVFSSSLAAAQDSTKQDWANYVRIGAYGLKGGDALQIVRAAQESGVFGIEVDNDIPGRYESYVHPEEKLKAIHDVAEAAHHEGNFAF